MNSQQRTLTVRDLGEDMIDVHTGRGVILQLTRSGSRFFFHGLGVGSRQHIGAEDPISGSEIPDGEFTEWLREELAR